MPHERHCDCPRCEFDRTDGQRREFEFWTLEAARHLVIFWDAHARLQRLITDRG